MTRVRLAAACWLTLAAPAAVCAPSYRQSYTILMKGVSSGTELVTEEWQQDHWVAESRSDILLSDGFETKRMAFTTRLVLSKTYAPVQYTYRYIAGPSGDGYDVRIQAGEISRVLTRGGRSSEVTSPHQPGTVILDFSVYHQFDYVTRKYDFKRAGRQVFPNYIPLIGSEISVALTRLQDSMLENAAAPLPVRNFRVELVGLWTGTLSTDAENRLVRLLVRDQNLEVVRSDLLAPAPAQAPVPPPASPPARPTP